MCQRDQKSPRPVARYGIVEIQDQVEAHQLGHAAGHVRVAAEVEEDLPAERNGGQEQGRCAEIRRVVINPLHVERQIVGQRQLLE